MARRASVLRLLLLDVAAAAAAAAVVVGSGEIDADAPYSMFR